MQNARPLGFFGHLFRPLNEGVKKNNFNISLRLPIEIIDE
jgi:hypothetical protein